MFTISKTIRVTDDTHTKIESIMASYGYKTFGDAVTFAVNKLFIEEEDEQEVVSTERDQRDIEEIDFLRDLALAQAKNTVTVHVNGGGGGKYVPDTELNQVNERQKKTLTAEQLAELRARMEKDMDTSVKELDAIYAETGGANPSMILDICEPEHKNSEVESLEEYQRRIKTRIKDARRGKLKAEKIVLDKQVKGSLEDTKAGVEKSKHPSGLPPPPP